MVVGGKRTPLSGYDPRYVTHRNQASSYFNYIDSRSLKRTKTYSSFGDFRPTIRNKPSGLVNNWPKVLAKTTVAAHHQPSALTPSTPSSSLTLTPSSSLTLTPSSSLTLTPSSSFTLTPSTPSPSTSYWQPQPSQVTPTRVDSFDSILSMSDIITPFSGQQSSLFNRVDQSANNIPQQIFQMVTAPNVF